MKKAIYIDILLLLLLGVVVFFVFQIEITISLKIFILLLISLLGNRFWSSYKKRTAKYSWLSLPISIDHARDLQSLARLYLYRKRKKLNSVSDDFADWIEEEYFELYFEKASALLKNSFGEDLLYGTYFFEGNDSPIAKKWYMKVEEYFVSRSLEELFVLILHYNHPADKRKQKIIEKCKSIKENELITNSKETLKKKDFEKVFKNLRIKNIQHTVYVTFFEKLFKELVREPGNEEKIRSFIATVESESLKQFLEHRMPKTIKL